MKDSRRVKLDDDSWLLIRPNYVAVQSKTYDICIVRDGDILLPSRIANVYFSSERWEQITDAFDKNK